MSDTVKSFRDFGVDERICTALDEARITTPFPIQELTLPLALSGADLIGQARTGTGKTLAFGIPILQRVDPSANRTQALVVVPTRELCLQVHDDLRLAGADKSVRIVAAYGGRAIDPQSEAIAAGAAVVVGTPGRLLDLMRRRLLHLSTVTTLVLDEADEMLDMGFLPDVEQLIEACAEQRQTMLFSATMPSEVVALARRYMDKPTFLRADVEEVRIAPETRQHFFSCHRMDKPAVLARILQTPERGLCVVFTRTKRMADTLVTELADLDVNAAAIHSDLRQEARERALTRFRQGRIDVLCATEVAARGLDIDDVTHVVNYDCPDDERMYLHRIGRTGRAGGDGVAITLAVWNELARLQMIKNALDIKEETHEVFSTSPLLTELFDLPDGRTPRRSGRVGTATAAGTRDEGATADRERDRSGPGRRRGRRDGKRGRRDGAAGGDAQAQLTPARSDAAVSATTEPDRPATTEEERPAAARPATDDRERLPAQPATDDAAPPATAQPTRDGQDGLEAAADRTSRPDGGRRARVRRRRDAAAEDPTGTATEDPTGTATEESTGTAADDTESGTPRRRRTRRRSVSVDVGERAAEARLRAEPSSDTEGGDEGSPEDTGADGARRRSRRRASTAGERAPRQPVDSDTDRSTDDTTRSPVTDGTDGPTGPSEGGTATRGRSQGRRTASRRGQHGGRRGSRSDTDGGRDRSDRDSARGRSDRRGRSPSPERETVPAAASVATAEEARGDGKPALRRPLIIAHLP